MRRFTVSLVQSRYLRVEVDAETQEEADNMAYKAAEAEITKTDCKWITSELEFCVLDDVKMYPVSIDLTKRGNAQDQSERPSEHKMA